MFTYFIHSKSDILVQLCLVLEKDIFIVFFYYYATYLLLFCVHERMQLHGL